KPILKKLRIRFRTRNGMHAFRHGRISYLAYSGVTDAVIREWVGHGSDDMIRHYTAKWQTHSKAEMAKLQPVVRSQNNSGNGNEVALLEPNGTKKPMKGEWRERRLVVYNQVPTMGRSPVAQR
ncbi:MAG TPA: site-specific integrase, partial [Candidatus Acidoferrales bacterium]|nr:site-specific integrase [Candidatus Acidoferrales bacterium]